MLFSDLARASIHSGLSGRPQTARLPLAPQAETDAQAGSELISPNPVLLMNNNSAPRLLRRRLAVAKEDCEALLRKQFGVRSLRVGMNERRKLYALRAVVFVPQETQRAAAAHVTHLVYFEPQDNMILTGPGAILNCRGLSKTGGRSLLDVIDETVPRGWRRLLRRGCCALACGAAK